MNEPAHYLRAGEIARLVSVSERTVRRWIADGTLVSSKICGTRLVARAALEQLLSSANRDLETPEEQINYNDDKSSI